MTRYLLLNLGFMLLAGSYFMAVWARHSEVKRLFVVMAALVTMTAVFDSLIIGLNLVNYNPAHILRVFIGKAPIEDFSYTIIAAILVPILWEQGAKHEK